MAKKLNSMPDYTSRLPKHPHDVSQSLTYTCTPGMLAPVYYDMLHLGDELHFSASEFVRLNPLEQQPLCDIDVHLDYFFVPLTVMYLPSSSLFYQTDDLVSSIFGYSKGELTTDSFPVFDFQAFFENAHNAESLDKRSPMYVDSVSHLYPSVFDSWGKSIFRVMDFLDMAPDTVINCINDPTGTVFNNYPSFTPWFALAYQAIYQLYFRNDDREPKNYHYNIDVGYNTGSIPVDTAYQAKTIFHLNYACRPKDYFNAVKVSPISSSTSLLSSSVLTGLYQTVNEWINSSQIVPVERASQSSSLAGSTQVKPSDGYLSTGNIRQMFMVEKLLRVVGRSEKNYESQFLAHYGIKIPHDVMHNITHIGHDMITIKPEAVISMANTWNNTTKFGSALGEIGGKGSGMLSGRKFNFTAPFHGVFMVISHKVPRKRYVLGINKLHQLNSPNKFWQPEFDQKGMQPLFNYEGAFGTDNQTMTARMGWQFAYEEFKRKADRVSRAFVPTRELTNTVNAYAPWVLASIPYSQLTLNGSYQAYAYTVGLQPYDLLVCPTDLNIAMQVPYNPYWSADFITKPWLIYQSDPFICDFNLYCKKVNRMSEYGEPEL